MGYISSLYWTFIDSLLASKREISAAVASNRRRPLRPGMMARSEQSNQIGRGVSNMKLRGDM